MISLSSMPMVSISARAAFYHMRLAAIAVGLLAFAGCTTSDSIPSQIATIETAQGSAENIAALTAVIRANPRDPAGYNVRGSAFGRSGNYKDALRDFDMAIKLNPRYFEAYNNRALIHRFYWRIDHCCQRL